MQDTAQLIHANLTQPSVVIDKSPANAQRKANWARLIQEVYAGPDTPWPKGETIPPTYHPLPDIA